MRITISPPKPVKEPSWCDKLPALIWHRTTGTVLLSKDGLAGTVLVSGYENTSKVGDTWAIRVAENYTTFMQAVTLQND